MSMVGELKQIVKDLREKSDADVCAIVSRNGIPIAYDGVDDGQVDTFATLSATILGASEVIYTGVQKQKPTRVFAESADGTFLGIPLGRKTLLIIMSGLPKEDLVDVVEKATSEITEVLKHGS